MAGAAQVSFEVLWELMAEHQIHLPRQQQIIHGSHQTQAILMAHPWSLKAENSDSDSDDDESTQFTVSFKRANPRTCSSLNPQAD